MISYRRHSWLSLFSPKMEMAGYRQTMLTTPHHQEGEERAAVTIDSHQQYHSAGLAEEDLCADPLSLFRRWFQAAQHSQLIPEPEAMCVSTATPNGHVSSRFVLLKKFDHRGFVFFTNYHSRKGHELQTNPRAALAFYWGPLHQQLRIGGRTEKIDPEESREYFKTRPIGSQIGAWSSPQSSQITGREELAGMVSAHERRFNVEPGSVDRETPTDSDRRADVPLPPHWGGVRVIPDEMEFWVGRPNRLHDRFVYRRDLSSDPHAPWTYERLAP